MRIRMRIIIMIRIMRMRIMKIRKRYRGGRRVAKKEDDSELGYILFSNYYIKIQLCETRYAFKEN